MDKFPAEVLLTIFKYLHLKQKIECMRVCRKWDHLLRKQGYDLETLELLQSPSSNSQYQIDWLLRREKEAILHPGNKCKRLLLYRGNSNLYLCLTTLAKSLPNLEFLMFQAHYRNESSSYSNENHPFNNWRRNLKTSIDVSPECRVFSDISANNMPFTQLTTLTLSFQHSQHSPENSPVLRQLTNAPQLTNFTTNMKDLTIDDLEVLHDSAPKLTSLTLLQSISINLDRAREIVVSPANALAKFEMRIYISELNRNAILTYMTKKYPALDELIVISDPDILVEGALWEVYINEDVALGWTTFLSTVGPNLKKCILPALYNVIDTLILYATNLGHLELTMKEFSTLSKFDLTEHTFQCLKKLSIGTLISTENLSTLKQLNNLTELVMMGSDHASKAPLIMLNTLIDILPDSLEALDLRFCRLVIDKRPPVSQQSNIKELKLCVFLVHEDISDYLSNHLPKLESVVLDGWNTNGGSNTLKLPNHRLKHVAINYVNRLNINHAPTMDEHLLHRRIRDPSLFLTRDEETLTYRISVNGRYAWVQPSFMNNLDVHDHSMRHVLRPTTNIHTNDESHNIYFECASVQTLYFYGYLIL